MDTDAEAAALGVGTPAFPGGVDRAAASNNTTPNNVVSMRSREAEQPPTGHPSGPRVAKTMVTPTDADTLVDRALVRLRAESPPPVSVRSVHALRPDVGVSMRAALAAVAFGQLGMGLAWLLGEVPFARIIGNPTPGHLSRDAALGVVLGTIGAIVAWRPRWSLSLLPVVGAIVAVQAIGLAVDASNGQSGFHFEFPHLLTIIVGALTFAGSRRRRYPQTS